MKIKKTFTIESNVWKKFDSISKLKSINKSLLVENVLKKIIEEYEIETKVE
jgi:hypothetical protein